MKQFFFACKKNLRKKEGRNKVINLAFAKATSRSGLKCEKKVQFREAARFASNVKINVFQVFFEWSGPK